MLSDDEKFMIVEQTMRAVKKYHKPVDDIIRLWRESADYVESIKEVFL
jgi:hypothetical protein